MWIRGYQFGSMSPLSYSAVLLAAGRSTRMGEDKALLTVGDLPLWRRQWAVLARAGVGEILLSARPDQKWVPDKIRVVCDAKSDAGPMAGITAALAWTKHSHLLVLAVDLPTMEAAWFAELMKLCAPGVGAVGRQTGFFEPLAAIYPRELLGAAEAALSIGDYSLQHFITSAGAAMRHREISRVNRSGSRIGTSRVII